MTKHSGDTLKVGNRIKLYGSYEMDPIYLKSPPAEARFGKVIQFIKGQNHLPAAVVQLDTFIKGDKIIGDIVVLEPRYQEQTWKDDGTGPVHIELCDFIPDNEKWENRKQGEWVEAAASWKIIKRLI